MAAHWRSRLGLAVKPRQQPWLCEALTAPFRARLCLSLKPVSLSWGQTVVFRRAAGYNPVGPRPKPRNPNRT